MQHRRMLRGSMLSNLNTHQYSWHHCSDYANYGPRYDQGELISGIPMSVSPLTWSFIDVNIRALLNTFQHYTWFVFIKKLTMSPEVVLVQ